jgi:protein tyrosine phosphatase (PTP) superfamily phosphohydrolase (DUF442 family)
MPAPPITPPACAGDSLNAGLPKLRAGEALLGWAVRLLGHHGLWLGGNFHAVEPGRAYRSGQLGPAVLAAAIRRHGLRTVISLRGGDEGDPWYLAQQQQCLALGVSLHAVRLTASRLPPPRQVRLLLRLLASVEQPLLFHCRGGADRSGLAATLFLHCCAGMDLETARARGLSWKYGHLGPRGAGVDRFFDLYGAHSGGMPLRDWIWRSYPALYKALECER